MSKSNTLENGMLALIFNGTTMANVAINATSSPLTNLYVSLHTASVGDAGDQTTNEATYGSYARVAVARNSTGWTVSGNSVTLTSDIDFAEATSGTETLTHFAVGTDVSGAGRVLYHGVLSPSVAVVTGITPRMNTGTTITED